MGFLLKEVLKTLCGANQWCYAVFWKFGCQNPNLLIWEECHYEPMSCTIPRSGLPLGEWEGSWASPRVQSSQSGIPAGDRVRTLINKMMMDNQVKVVGEGIVGRSAFSGKHQWILSNNYISHAPPPEVSNEVHTQFSAGMQTVAVIPVLPHGVVQFGSPLAMLENVGFLNHVKCSILQLGCIPGALLFDHYSSKVSTEEFVIPVTFGMHASANSSGLREVINSTPSVTGSFNQQSNRSHASRPVGQPVHPLKQQVQDSQSVDISAMKRLNLPFTSPSQNGVLGADGIDSNLDAWSNQHASLDRLRLYSDHFPNNGQVGVSHSNLRLIEQNVSDAGVQSHGIGDMHIPNSCDIGAAQLRTNGGLALNTPKNSIPITEGCRIQNCVLNRQGSTDTDLCRGHVAGYVEPLSKEVEPNEQIYLTRKIPGLGREYQKHESGSRSATLKYEEERVQSSSGNDLFDVLGVEYKNKILNGNSNGLIATDLDVSRQNMFKDASVLMNGNNAGSEVYSLNKEIADNGLFSGMGTDHLLDAVVSRAQSVFKQSSDDNVSCRTAVTRIGSSSIPNTSPTYGVSTRSDQAFDLPNSLPKQGDVGSSSFKSVYGKDEPESCSQGSSIYGCRISSWVEQGHNVKHGTSVSTAFSKKPDDNSKLNRKRLKPGENPRPRPKDRQMIQDRVKELRELVPSGAKCSIDALLELTIKHMLFLQSVTKHADKLKQTGESKIVSKEGGLLLKDNWDGGVTWAFEVGSRSMLCPIIVEDLNSPRQMLVEMLCEERGFFLEIADLIRGMGLTILKGVMETRNHKIWARFAVETEREVTRMEIFMSLVRLLEQTVKGNAYATTSIDNHDMVVRHASSIPASMQ